MVLAEHLFIQKNVDVLVCLNRKTLYYAEAQKRGGGKEGKKKASSI